LDDISYIVGEISPHFYVEIDASDIFVNELKQTNKDMSQRILLEILLGRFIY
jgi:hypothetical protein